MLKFLKRQYKIIYTQINNSTQISKNQIILNNKQKYKHKNSVLINMLKTEQIINNKNNNNIITSNHSINIYLYQEKIIIDII